MAASQAMLYFLDWNTNVMMVSVALVALAEGGAFVNAAIIAYEDYGIKKATKILAFFFTAAAVGILVFVRFVLNLNPSSSYVNYEADIDEILEATGVNR